MSLTNSRRLISVDEAIKKKAEFEKSQHTERELDSGEPPMTPDTQNVE